MPWPTCTWYQGKYREAEPLYRDIVERRTRVLGADHPDTLRANYDLASLYVKQKRWEEYEDLSRDTLARQRRVLGDNHPDTLASLSNSQAYYFEQGRYEEALPVAVEVLESERRLFGEDHPTVLIDLHNLASIYDKLGRYGEAEPLYLKAADTRRRVLGSDHPQNGDDPPRACVVVYETAAVRRGRGRFSRSVPRLRKERQWREPGRMASSSRPSGVVRGHWPAHQGGRVASEAAEGTVAQPMTDHDNPRTKPDAAAETRDPGGEHHRACSGL